MRVLFSAGEASGDVYAAEIAKRLALLVPQATMAGIGGPRSREAGIRLLADSSSWGAVGVGQVLRIYLRARRGMQGLIAELRSGNPGLFVPIDYGYMNVKLARIAKSSGWKVLYFSPPGAWRRDRQGPSMPQVADAIVTPFSWSAEILQKMGANAHWFGHPLRELIGESAPPEQRSGIAVLPGSRKAEVDLLLPTLADALAEEAEPCRFAVAPNFEPETMKKFWLERNPKRSADRFEHGRAARVLAETKAGVICSGTATLEAALCHCPHVVVYKLGILTLVQALVFMKRPKYISLPNILLDEPVVPELIQHHANPEAIRNRLAELLADSPQRRAQLDAFRRLEAMLGPADGLTKTAELAAAMMEGQNAAPV